MTDFLILALVALAVGLAGYYIRRQKKKGNPCIGCPYSAGCNGACCGHPEKNMTKPN